MVTRFMTSIRRVQSRSGFESYFNGVERGGAAGIPTAEQARRDYRAAIQTRYRFLDMI